MTQNLVGQTLTDLRTGDRILSLGGITYQPPRPASSQQHLARSIRAPRSSAFDWSTPTGTAPSNTCCTRPKWDRC